LGLEPGTITDFASWARHVPADDVATIQRGMAAAADRKEARFPFRYCFTRHDGQNRQIQGSAHLFCNDQGRLESTIGVNVVVTDFERSPPYRKGDPSPPASDHARSRWRTGRSTVTGFRSVRCRRRWPAWTRRTARELSRPPCRAVETRLRPLVRDSAAGTA
jgi:hypothetical protein